MCPAPDGRSPQTRPGNDVVTSTDGRVLANGRQVTFSCGIATDDETGSFDAVVTAADERLREAKRRGKARVLSA